MKIKSQVILPNQSGVVTKLLIVLLGIFLLFPLNVFSYEFSDVRNSLVRDLEKWQGYASRNKIAIVFNNEAREQIKQNYNLVGLKRDLSNELLKSFDVADPIIVQEIIKSNKLEYRQIADSKSVLGQFADRANSVHVLLVDLQPKSKTLIAEFKLINRDYSRVSSVITEIAPEEKSRKIYSTDQAANQSSEPDSSIFDSFSPDFASPGFTADQNDSWIYFSPTALLNPQVNSIHLALWFKDLGDVDVQAVRFRYGLKLLELLQFSVQTYAITEKANSQAETPNTDKESGLHSAYASIKFLMVEDTVLPVNFSVGIRRRIFWDPDNTDFRSQDLIDKNTDPGEYDDAKELDDNNDRYNTLTLQAMMTGKLENIGLLFNVYIDSQTVGAGAKFIVAQGIKLFADNVYYYFEEPDILTDSAAGIQFYNSYGSADLMYQFETKQIQLGFNLDF